MRRILALGCVLLLAHGVAAQKDPSSARPTRKGDTLTVKGCLSGNALEATDTNAPDLSGVLAGGLTFRLTGEKALLKELREKHDGRVVDVRGVLKSEPPQPSGQGPSVGRVRIGIGQAPSTGRLEAESRRALPVLEVKSFRDGLIACGR